MTQGMVSFTAYGALCKPLFVGSLARYQCKTETPQSRWATGEKMGWLDGGEGFLARWFCTPHEASTVKRIQQDNRTKIDVEV